MKRREKVAHSAHPNVPQVKVVSSSQENGDERSYFASNLSFLTYSYRENLFAELERLSELGRGYDGLVIDLMQTGYSLPLEALVKFSIYAKRLLKPQGVLLFIKAEGAITLTKDDPGGGLTFNAYDSPFGIFARHPMLADYVCATVQGIDRRRLKGGSTLANHILYTSIPVLTDEGKRARDAKDLPEQQLLVLQSIDDYSSVESVSRVMENEHHLLPDETLRILQEFESSSLIYPIFFRIQFLANCYHNRKAFRLGRYMVASGILTEAQLQELLERQEEEAWGKAHKTALGALAVREGYINSRELEVMLDDQYLYGGYHKVAEEDSFQPQRTIKNETMRDSMIGSLGAIDAAGLLQSFSTAKKTGLLTIENRDQALIVSFSFGRPTHARMNKLKGYDAMVEFLVEWSEGIFVFRDKGTSQELDASCALREPLDKMLIDAALLQDQIKQILSYLPAGRNTILERIWNFEALWNKLSTRPLKYFDETLVTDNDKQAITELANLIDGLSTLDEIIRLSDGWPGHMVIKSIHVLLENKLVNIQQASLFRPLSIFQRIVAELEKTIGRDDNKSLLTASLEYVHGNTYAMNRFDIDHEGRVSVNLSQVKSTGTPVSSVLLELRRWMEAYLAYCRRQVDSQIVDSIVAKVVNSKVS